jgi:glucokinase
VYVGGCIAPKILSKLREPLFMNAFCDKGRLRPLMESIPVRVVLNDKTALLGAAHVAMMYCEPPKNTKVRESPPGGIRSSLGRGRTNA